MQATEESGRDGVGVAIVLAAGRSRRMGTDKALLPWVAGQALAQWMRDQFLQLKLRPIFVFGPHNFAAGEALLGSSYCVNNPDCDTGRASSLRTGLRAVQRSAGILALCGVDQPRELQLLGMLRDAALANPRSIVVPMKNAHRGHPVFCGREFRPAAAEIREETLGLRGWLNQHPDCTIRIRRDSPQPDLNTHADYAAALPLFEN